MISVNRSHQPGFFRAAERYFALAMRVVPRQYRFDAALLTTFNFRDAVPMIAYSATTVFHRVS